MPTERPAKPGVYWYRRPGSDWIVVELAWSERAPILLAGIAGEEHWIPVENLTGEFRGPLRPPPRNGGTKVSQPRELTSKDSFMIAGRGRVLVVPTNGRGQELFDGLKADMESKSPVKIDGKPYLVQGIESIGRPRFAENFGVLVKEIA